MGTYIKVGGPPAPLPTAIARGVPARCKPEVPSSPEHLSTCPVPEGLLVLTGSNMPWNCSKLPTVEGKAPAECKLEADGCMCSRGCQSTYACSPSALCSRTEVRASDATLKVPIVLFLQFNESLVRHKYAANPAIAYRREFNRILWFVESARRVQTRMPLYVAVGGRRNHSAEAHLQRLGVGIVSLPFVAPPLWSSLFHHFSFSRIAALALTQFEKVVVMDNDMVLLGNIDELAEHAEAPGMVWHTATVLAKKERSAVTGGLFVLKPDAAEYARALHHLYHELNRRPRGTGVGLNAGRRCYDGSDQAPGPACHHARSR